MDRQMAIHMLDMCADIFKRKMEKGDLVVVAGCLQDLLIHVGLAQQRIVYGRNDGLVIDELETEVVDADTPTT